jgi:hypothetical protein
MVVISLQCSAVVIPCTLYPLRTTFSSSKDTREVSSSHCGALGFLVSMIFLQSFHFEALLVYEPKVDFFSNRFIN